MDRTTAQVQDAMLRAVSGASSDVDLRDLLVGVVRAACTLAGARRGALEMTGDCARQLVECVVDGVGEDERALPGPPPPARDLPGRPPVPASLDVPVRVRGRDFGTLHLADKASGGPFTVDDERAVLAMAHLAGVAVEHANLHVLSARRTPWLEATALMPADVMRAPLPQDALVAVLDHALAAAQGVTAIAIAPTPSGRFAVRAAVGDPSVDPAQTLETLHPTLMLAMATSSTRSVALPTGIAMMTRLVLDPLTRGALVIVLPPGRPAGEAGHDPGDDADLVADYARQASQALERHHARSTQEQLAVLAERNRIARDLHDVVIQRLYALGLQLKTISNGLGAETKERVDTVISDLDDTIGEIRRSIVDLRPTDRRRSVRSKVQTLVTEYTHVLGYAPTLTVTGPLDTLLEPALGEHLVAVLREALSNTARHASATRMWLEIDISPAHLVCTVSDDGVGCDQPAPLGGLRNLAERASELGGTLRVGERAPHGCVLTWEVPLPVH